ncbi:MAG: hypothetical protein Q9195_005968 [Heterodermia aff. obscurata]
MADGVGPRIEHPFLLWDPKRRILVRKDHSTMTNGNTPSTENPQALLRDQNAVHPERPLTREASPPPLSDFSDWDEDRVEGDEWSCATAGRGTKATPIKGRAKVPDSINDHAKVPDQPFRLMDLPLEIRSMIFREYLVMPGPVFFGRSGWKRLEPFATDDFPERKMPCDDFTGMYPESNKILQSGLVNIFSVSKTIYRETVPLYFGCNQFDFFTLDDLERFLSKIGPEYRWQIASITVNHNGRAPARAVKRLAECVGLRRLTLHIESYSFGGNPRSPHEARLLGMKDLLRMRGLDKIVISYDVDEMHFLFKSTFLPQQDVIDSLKERLEVLKEARDPKQLMKQEKKDFPTKAKRTVFGAANVVTRSERQMLDTQH